MPHYVVELAKSGRAGCKACKQKIAKDTIRLGVECEGDWGTYYRWHHLTCVNMTNVTEDNLSGLELLEAEDQQVVRDRIGQGVARRQQRQLLCGEAVRWR